MNSHQTKHRKTSKLSLLYLFYSKKWKQWYLAFADLSILFLIQSLNGRLKRDTDSLVRKLNSHDALITWAWNACDESLSRIDSSVHLGADHQKSYGGGWGIFEPQEFFFVIKLLVWIVFRPWHEYLLGLIFVQEFFLLYFCRARIFFFCTSLAPTPVISFLMVRPLIYHYPSDLGSLILFRIIPWDHPKGTHPK